MTDPGEKEQGCPGSWQPPKNDLYPDRGQCRWCLDWFPRLADRGGQLGFHADPSDRTEGSDG